MIPRESMREEAIDNGGSVLRAEAKQMERFVF